MMMRPVGVGRTSRGPTGVDGLTMTAGSLFLRDHALDQTVPPRLCFSCRRRSRLLLRAALFRRLAGRLGLQRQRRHAAGVDHALDAGVERGVHDGARARDVVLDDLARIGRPQPIIRRDMKQVPHARHGRRERRRIAQIAGGVLDIDAVEVGARAGGAHQRADGIALLGEQLGHRRPDEAGGSRHQYPSKAAHLLKMLVFSDA